MNASESRRLVYGLGLTQLISWGALIYAIAVLGAPMATDLGVSQTAVFGAFSLSLAVSGVVSPRVGRLIDRAGGRRVLSLGSLFAGLSLAGIASAPSIETFVLAWACAGVATAMTLYEAAFATISQHAAPSFRKSVTSITLIGGLAGSAAFPLSLVGLEYLGWRGTLLAFAAVEAAICLPLHLWCIPTGPGGRAVDATAGRKNASPRSATRHDIVFYALASSFALTAFITSALAAHLINLLKSSGLAIASAVAVASLIGPMQVLGRIVEFAFGRRFSSRAIGAGTLVLMIASLVALFCVDGRMLVALVFAVTFGWSNGVQTIIRGTVPAELFGHDGYGALVGRLAFPSFVARAVAPIALTLPAITSNHDVAVPLLIAASLLSLAAYAVAVRSARG